MPQKWQRWIPFEIDAFFGSPAVQAMHPAAQMGYWRLICAAWQTEDCTITTDALDLAEKSGLGDELWALYGPRILRKFDPTPETLSARSASTNGSPSVEKLRNAPLYEKWNEAKRVAESRQKGAERTNSARSASTNGSPSATVSERSAGATHAGVRALLPLSVPVSVPVLVSPVNGESGSELRHAAWIFEEANVPCDNSLVRVAGDCIRKLGREAGISSRDAAQVILDAAKAAIAEGEPIVRFWFTDQRYKPQKAPKRKLSAREQRVHEFMNAPTEDGS
jgi:hypothetical protein